MFGALTILLVASAGCRSPDSELNAVARSEMEKRDAELQGRREHWLARQRASELAITDAQQRTALIEQRAQLAEQQRKGAAATLEDELTTLHHIEQDLVAARVRAIVVQQELAPLRALETKIAQKETMLRTLRETDQRLAAELAVAQAAAASRTSSTTASIAELQQRVRRLQDAEAVARAALEHAASRPHSTSAETRKR